MPINWRYLCNPEDSNLLPCRLFKRQLCVALWWYMEMNSGSLLFSKLAHPSITESWILHAFLCWIPGSGTIFTLGRLSTTYWGLKLWSSSYPLQPPQIVFGLGKAAGLLNRSSSSIVYWDIQWSSVMETFSQQVTEPSLNLEHSTKLLAKTWNMS